MQEIGYCKRCRWNQAFCGLCGPCRREIVYEQQHELRDLLNQMAIQKYQPQRGRNDGLQQA